MSPLEPQSAADYDDRSTEAVKSVLLEIGQILGSYKGKFVIVGGLIPWLLQNVEEMPHVGTLDIDLGLDPLALADGEYASLIELLQSQGYRQRADLRQFQLVRELPQDDGSAPIEVVVDFLMQRDVKVVKNRPPLVEDFRVQEVSGADLAIRFAEDLRLTGDMPGGGTNFDDYGPTSVRKFVEETDALQERSPEQWQQDAFGVVDQWLKLLGLREA